MSCTPIRNGVAVLPSSGSCHARDSAHTRHAAPLNTLCRPPRTAYGRRRSRRPSTQGTRAVPDVSEITLPLAWNVSLFDLTRSLDSTVSASLSSINPFTYFLVLSAGLASSLSPCTLSVLPLTIGYIGGYTQKEDGSSSALGAAVPFGAGVASTLTALGLASSLLGSVYGQTGDTLPFVVAIVAIIMGLNLLGVINFRLPSLDVDVRGWGVPVALQAYLAGVTFALAASPCSTPILATLLGFSATQGSFAVSATLLFVYALGYIAPVIVAASATEAMKTVLSFRQYSAFLTPTSGVLLIAGGTYALLSRI